MHPFLSNTEKLYLRNMALASLRTTIPNKTGVGMAFVHNADALPHFGPFTRKQAHPLEGQSNVFFFPRSSGFSSSFVTSFYYLLSLFHLRLR